MQTIRRSRVTPKPTSNTGKNARGVTLDTKIDDTLVQRFTAGDEGAFVQIMERYRAKIYAAVLMLLRNHTDADEITQDTFVSAHRALAGFPRNSSLAAWLLRIAINLSNRYRYFSGRHHPAPHSFDCALNDGGAAYFSDLRATAGSEPAREVVAKEFAGLMEICMCLLDVRHREILTLRNVLNHSYDEIATRLGINVSAVQSRLARARESLRSHLSETCPEFALVETYGEWFLPSRRIYRRVEPACA